MIPTIVKIGRRGQITLPRSLRRRLGFREGDRIAFVYSGDEIILRPLTSTLLDLRGSIPVEGPQDFTAIRRQVIQAHAGKVVRDEA